jgi:three-Cys-motif partner protein
MATGTRGDYWVEKTTQSAFKHELLRQYAPVFGGTTGSKSERVYYVDGFAGQGRYDNGQPGSADLVLRIAAGQASKVRWSCVFTEKDSSSAAKLRAVVDEYRATGVDAVAHHADIGTVLDGIVTAAVGSPLFLFLDPTGFGVSFDRLATLLRTQRTGVWPPTEVLLNFTTLGVRRAAGGDDADERVARNRARMEQALGGDWWRPYFASLDREDADDAVAREFARRLGQHARMQTVAVPVWKTYRHRKTVYYMIYGTRSQTGLWEFGKALCKAQTTWWHQVDVQEQASEDALFSAAFARKPDPEVLKGEATPVLAENIATLLRRYPKITLGEHTLEVFGEYYGRVPDTVARAAVKLLRKQDRTSSTGVGKQIRKLVVLRPQ